MIFTYIFTALLVLVSLLVQGHSSFDVLRIAGVKPDLVFIIVVYMGYSFGPFYGEVTGFLAGLAHDAISISPLGFLALPKMIIGFVAGFFNRQYIKSNLLSVMILVFIASLLKGLVTLILAYIFHHGAIEMTLRIILPESFYNALVSPALFFVMDRIFEKDLEREGLL